VIVTRNRALLRQAHAELRQGKKEWTDIQLYLFSDVLLICWRALKKVSTTAVEEEEEERAFALLNLCSGFYWLTTLLPTFLPSFLPT
jgi:hypothetical protein